ncbi:putative Inositol 1,4,5-trisphosphate receptor itr-1 [Blattamonas nauphoetae]|uniref:Inositol 1,4,5-trisphosphate receptor itr-1 n=1 Tax=Blattamonas nauphoetae TaxID=2049346 RepID=A0ABQ9YL99_9EUKA|nr:putative Inositol 1,4,5-trisphosphate receptor itr-1 [Blattamonas nauphoetae]
MPRTISHRSVILLTTSVDNSPVHGFLNSTQGEVLLVRMDDVLLRTFPSGRKYNYWIIELVSVSQEKKVIPDSTKFVSSLLIYTAKFHSFSLSTNLPKVFYNQPFYLRSFVSNLYLSSKPMIHDEYTGEDLPFLSHFRGDDSRQFEWEFRLPQQSLQRSFNIQDPVYSDDDVILYHPQSGFTLNFGSFETQSNSMDISRTLPSSIGSHSRCYVALPPKPWKVLIAPFSDDSGTTSLSLIQSSRFIVDRSVIGLKNCQSGGVTNDIIQNHILPLTNGPTDDHHVSVPMIGFMLGSTQPPQKTDDILQTTDLSWKEAFKSGRIEDFFEIELWTPEMLGRRFHQDSHQSKLSSQTGGDQDFLPRTPIIHNGDYIRLKHILSKQYLSCTEVNLHNKQVCEAVRQGRQQHLNLTDVVKVPNMIWSFSSPYLHLSLATGILDSLDSALSQDDVGYLNTASTFFNTLFTIHLPPPSTTSATILSSSLFSLVHIATQATVCVCDIDTTFCFVESFPRDSVDSHVEMFTGFDMTQFNEDGDLQPVLFSVIRNDNQPLPTKPQASLFVMNDPKQNPLALNINPGDLCLSNPKYAYSWSNVTQVKSSTFFSSKAVPEFFVSLFYESCLSVQSLIRMSMTDPSTLFQTEEFMNIFTSLSALLSFISPEQIIHRYTNSEQHGSSITRTGLQLDPSDKAYLLKLCKAYAVPPLDDQNTLPVQSFSYLPTLAIRAGGFDISNPSQLPSIGIIQSILLSQNILDHIDTCSKLVSVPPGDPDARDPTFPYRYLILILIFRLLTRITIGCPESSQTVLFRLDELWDIVEEMEKKKKKEKEIIPLPSLTSFALNMAISVVASCHPSLRGLIPARLLQKWLTNADRCMKLLIDKELSKTAVERPSEEDRELSLKWVTLLVSFCSFHHIILPVHAESQNKSDRENLISLVVPTSFIYFDQMHLLTTYIPLVKTNDTYNTVDPFVQYQFLYSVLPYEMQQSLLDTEFSSPHTYFNSHARKKEDTKAVDNTKARYHPLDVFARILFSQPYLQQYYTKSDQNSELGILRTNIDILNHRAQHSNQQQLVSSTDAKPFDFLGPPSLMKLHHSFLALYVTLAASQRPRILRSLRQLFPLKYLTEMVRTPLDGRDALLEAKPYLVHLTKLLFFSSGTLFYTTQPTPTQTTQTSSKSTGNRNIEPRIYQELAERSSRRSNAPYQPLYLFDAKIPETGSTGIHRQTITTYWKFDIDESHTLKQLLFLPVDAVPAPITENIIPFVSALIDEISTITETPLEHLTIAKFLYLNSCLSALSYALDNGKLDPSQIKSERTRIALTNLRDTCFAKIRRTSKPEGLINPEMAVSVQLFFAFSHPPLQLQDDQLIMAHYFSLCTLHVCESIQFLFDTLENSLLIHRTKTFFKRFTNRYHENKADQFLQADSDPPVKNTEIEKIQVEDRENFKTNWTDILKSMDEENHHLLQTALLLVGREHAFVFRALFALKHAHFVTLVDDEELTTAIQPQPSTGIQLAKPKIEGKSIRKPSIQQRAEALGLLLRWIEHSIIYAEELWNAHILSKLTENHRRDADTKLYQAGTIMKSTIEQSLYDVYVLLMLLLNILHNTSPDKSVNIKTASRILLRLNPIQLVQYDNKALFDQVTPSANQHYTAIEQDPELLELFPVHIPNKEPLKQLRSLFFQFDGVYILLRVISFCLPAELQPLFDLYSHLLASQTESGRSNQESITAVMKTARYHMKLAYDAKNNTEPSPSETKGKPKSLTNPVVAVLNLAVSILHSAAGKSEANPELVRLLPHLLILCFADGSPAQLHELILSTATHISSSKDVRTEEIAATIDFGTKLLDIVFTLEMSQKFNTTKRSTITKDFSNPISIICQVIIILCTLNGAPFDKGQTILFNFLRSMTGSQFVEKAMKSGTNYFSRNQSAPQDESGGNYLHSITFHSTVVHLISACCAGGVNIRGQQLCRNFVPLTNIFERIDKEITVSTQISSDNEQRIDRDTRRAEALMNIQAYLHVLRSAYLTPAQPLTERVFSSDDNPPPKTFMLKTKLNLILDELMQLSDLPRLMVRLIQLVQALVDEPDFCRDKVIELFLKMMSYATFSTINMLLDTILSDDLKAVVTNKEYEKRHDHTIACFNITRPLLNLLYLIYHEKSADIIRLKSEIMSFYVRCHSPEPLPKEPTLLQIKSLELKTQILPAVTNSCKRTSPEEDFALYSSKELDKDQTQLYWDAFCERLEEESIGLKKKRAIHFFNTISGIIIQKGNATLFTHLIRSPQTSLISEYATQYPIPLIFSNHSAIAKSKISFLNSLLLNSFMYYLQTDQSKGTNDIYPAPINIIIERQEILFKSDIIDPIITILSAVSSITTEDHSSLVNSLALRAIRLLIFIIAGGNDEVRKDLIPVLQNVESSISQKSEAIVAYPSTSTKNQGSIMNEFARILQMAADASRASPWWKDHQINSGRDRGYSLPLVNSVFALINQLCLDKNVAAQDLLRASGESDNEEGKIQNVVLSMINYLLSIIPSTDELRMSEDIIKSKNTHKAHKEEEEKSSIMLFDFSRIIPTNPAEVCDLNYSYELNKGLPLSFLTFPSTKPSKIDMFDHLTTTLISFTSTIRGPNRHNQNLCVYNILGRTLLNSLFSLELDMEKGINEKLFIEKCTRLQTLDDRSYNPIVSFKSFVSRKHHNMNPFDGKQSAYRDSASYMFYNHFFVTPPSPWERDFWAASVSLLRAIVEGPFGVKRARSLLQSTQIRSYLERRLCAMAIFIRSDGLALFADENEAESFWKQCLHCYIAYHELIDRDPEVSEQINEIILTHGGRTGCGLPDANELDAQIEGPLYPCVFEPLFSPHITSVEIIRENRLQKFYFPIPEQSKALVRKDKDLVNNSLDHQNLQEKLTQFQLECNPLYDVASNRQSFRSMFLSRPHRSIVKRAIDKVFPPKEPEFDVVDLQNSKIQKEMSSLTAPTVKERNELARKARKETKHQDHLENPTTAQTIPEELDTDMRELIVPHINTDHVSRARVKIFKDVVNFFLYCFSRTFTRYLFELSFFIFTLIINIVLLISVSSFPNSTLPKSLALPCGIGCIISSSLIALSRIISDISQAARKGVTRMQDEKKSEARIERREREGRRRRKGASDYPVNELQQGIVHEHTETGMERPTIRGYAKSFCVNVLLNKQLWVSFIMIFASFLGFLVHEGFFIILLFDILTKVDAMSVVLNSITKQLSRILLTGLLLIVMVYYFSIIGYMMFADSFVMDRDDPFGERICSTIYECLVTLIATLPTGGKWMEKRFLFWRYDGDLFKAHYHLFEMLYQFLFYMICLVILLAIISGFIVDTFKDLSDEDEKKKRAKEERCFACGLSSTPFAAKGIPFSVHRNGDHNAWRYFALFVHLFDTVYGKKETMNKNIKKAYKKQVKEAKMETKAARIRIEQKVTLKADLENDKRLAAKTTAMIKAESKEIMRKREEHRLKERLSTIGGDEIWLLYRFITNDTSFFPVGRAIVLEGEGNLPIESVSDLEEENTPNGMEREDEKTEPENENEFEIDLALADYEEKAIYHQLRKETVLLRQQIDHTKRITALSRADSDFG